MTIKQKVLLLATGETAFVAVVQQIDYMLDVIHFFMSRYPDTTISIAHKHEWLKDMINTLGSKPYELSEVIRRWKHEEPRVLSQVGVELNILNEIWITLDVLFEFMKREDIGCSPYNHLQARIAFAALRQVNKCIP